MPVMQRRSGKPTKIVESILGTQANKHKPHLNTPRVREVNLQTFLLRLGLGGTPGNDNMQMPQ